MGRNRQINKQGDNDMKLRRIITCICLLFMAVYSYAQNTLNGTIESEEGVKIEYATVRLLTPDSIFVAGTITDTKGVHPTFRVIRQSCRAYNLSLK